MCVKPQNLFALSLLLASLLSPGLVSADDYVGEEVVITVDSTNLRFSPSEVTIQEGDSVRFFWSGQLLPHNAVAEDGTFDSGDPSREVDYTFVFELGTNGTYEFVCEPHESAGMVGTINVEPAPVANESDIVQDGDQLDSEEIQDDSSSIHLDAIYLVILLIIVYFVGRSRGGTNLGYSNQENTDQEE